MIIKDIAKKEIPEIGNILPLKKNNIFPIRIDKTIEIVTVPKLANKKENQKNVGIVLEEKIILKILSKRYKNVLITEINTEKDLEKLVIRKPDLVFSGVKYFYFNSKIIWLNDYLEMYDIPYIASSKAALDKESDKNQAKKIMQKAKIKTADFFITTPGKHSNELSIPIKFPVFIKPVTGGDSRGIDLNSGIFEDSIDGALRAMPIEIIVKENKDGHRILDYNVKKNDEEKVIPVTDIKIFKKLSKLAKDSFKALGGKSLGRIDIRMDHRGIPHFMEANLMPGLRKGYFYRSCVLNLDMSYEDMIFSIANTGLSSH